MPMIPASNQDYLSESARVARWRNSIFSNRAQVVPAHTKPETTTAKMWRTFSSEIVHDVKAMPHTMREFKAIAHSIAHVVDPKSRIEMLSKLAISAAAHSSPQREWNRVSSGVTQAYNEIVHGDLTRVADGVFAAGSFGVGGVVFKGATKLRLFSTKLFGVERLATDTPEFLANKALNQVRLAQKKFSTISPNAAEALARKFRALEGAQSDAVRAETLSDGRIRYYEEETLARTSGPTRGSAFVTEHNPLRAMFTRGWNHMTIRGI